MFLSSPRPTLRTLQPSPTTTSYTVSTAPVRVSSLDAAINHLSVALRITTAVVSVLLLLSIGNIWGYLAWSLERGGGMDISHIGVWQEWAHVTGLARKDGFHGKLVGAVCMALLYALSRREHTEETLLIIRGLGIQISTSSASRASSATTRFIPTAQVQDILIHEAFKGFEVRFYLAVIVEGEEEAVVVFPKLLPRREVLEEVWKGSREVLFKS